MREVSLSARILVWSKSLNLEKISMYVCYSSRLCGLRKIKQYTINPIRTMPNKAPNVTPKINPIWVDSSKGQHESLDSSSALRMMDLTSGFSLGSQKR